MQSCPWVAQAKGKIPRTMTAADERREKENGNTVARIFPGPFGRDAVLTQMVDRATERIDAVNGRASDEPRPPGHQGSSRRRDPAARAALTVSWCVLPGLLPGAEAPGAPSTLGLPQTAGIVSHE